MTIKVKNFYVPKVDSLRVRIPMRDVEILNPMLFEKVITISESSGEIYKEETGIPFQKDEDGISYKIWRSEERLIHMPSTPQKFIYFLLNSKHLKESYFEGINLGNIQKIIDGINKHKVIKISKSKLLRAGILDVDLCVDFPATQKEFKKYVVDKYKSMAIVGPKDTIKGFNSSNNIGLELNKRHNQFPSKPHAKFYHKSTELLNSSNLFAERYLKDFDWENIGRFEFNLKNRRWFRQYGLENVRTLEDLLNLNSKQKIFQDVYSNWFIERLYKAKRIPSDTYLHKQLWAAWDYIYLINRNLDGIKKTNDEAIHEANDRNQIGKIRKLYHQYVNQMIDKEQIKMIKESKLPNQLDMFFGLDPVTGLRTYDVRSSVIDSSTKINNSKP